jgi:hypothetical protein
MSGAAAPFRYGLSPEIVRWVEDVLSNDENSTNAELASYFQRQGLSRLQAESVLRHREDYLLNIYRTGEGPLHSR